MPMALAYQPGMPPTCLLREKRLTKNKKQGGNLPSPCQKLKKEKKKKVEKGWVPQRAES